MSRLNYELYTEIAMETDMFICPQCSTETINLNEGYCEDCSQENQLKLDQHNFEFDAWERLAANERDARIKGACV